MLNIDHIAYANISKRDVQRHASLCGWYPKKWGSPRLLQGWLRSLVDHVVLWQNIHQGTLTPLLGIGVCVSIQFGVLEYTKRYFTTRNRQAGQDAAQSSLLNSSQLLVAGALAGLGNGFVSGPVEHIRIRASLRYPRPYVLLSFRGQGCKLSRTRTPSIAALSMP